MVGRVFKIALRGKGKILFPQCSGMINFAGGYIFLLGGGNLMSQVIWTVPKIII